MNVSLDFRLGLRMLGKYPGLTLVGGIAMAFGIAAGAAVFEFVTQFMHPTLPFRDGDRMIGISVWDRSTTGARSPSLDDFLAWKDTATSLRQLGAFRKIDRNLVTSDGNAAPIEVAEISASAFELTGVAAWLGRTLVTADEDLGSPPVIVIGYDLWQARFGGDPNAVGTTVRLGDSAATIVGVMPRGFAFPVAHRLWAPLRIAGGSIGNRHNPNLAVFGRLAPGVSRRQADAEVATIGVRSPEDASRRQQMRPEVLPYAESLSPFRGFIRFGVYSINVFLALFMALVCANVGLLMLARAATRESEIVLRAAIGATRARILTQLFIEALVLGGVAAAAGLVGAQFVLGRWLAMVRATERVSVPFWLHDTLAPATVVYAAVLTLLGAAIAGVLPVVKLTRGLADRLRAHSAGGYRFGSVWTAVIVTQIAVTLAFPVMAYLNRLAASQAISSQLPFAAQQYLTSRLETDRGPISQSLSDVRRRLDERLAQDSAVTGVTFASRLPGMQHRCQRIAIESGSETTDVIREPRACNASIDADYFDVLGIDIRAGRAFQPSELAGDARVAIVNESFVNRILAHRNPIGRRFRYLDCPERQARGATTACPWFEIVGVVSDLGMMTDEDLPASGPGIYHPLLSTNADPVYIAVHVNGEPRAFADRLRAVAATVDPNVRLFNILPLHEVRNTQLFQNTFWFQFLVSISALAVLLSLSGIYAVMAFTVSRRTREIGIRVALGAERGRVMATILARPIMQVAIGIGAGAVLVAAIVRSAAGDAFGAGEVVLVAAYAVAMLCVCMLACIVPTRRGLRVEPMVALRAE
jgi:predicted permease